MSDLQIDPSDVFTRTVDAADARFRRACERAGAEPAVFPHPLRGPHGEPLATTVAQVGPRDAERHLVVVSATHGAEGHAGSAIQCAALGRLQAAALPGGVAVTFIHLINPWGCAWDRKENEDNVDLHRNFTYPLPPFPENPDYDAVAGFLMLTELAGPDREAADRELSAYVESHGFGALSGIVVAGTHTHAKGIRFNGSGPTWSSRTLTRIMDGWLGAAREILVLDIHTGFGPNGLGQIMTYARPGTREHARLSAWYGDVAVVGGGQSRLAVHPCMPYHRMADRLVQADIAVAALEFGTDNAPRIDLELIREENFIHMRGDPFSPEGRIIRSRMRKRFNWEYPAWQEAILRRGLEVFDKSVTAVGAAFPG
jgi:polar amino acid transport system ATP-binding protein